MKNRTQINGRAQGAFTLVELLVVIAIIGILAAMLLPVLTAVKKKAQVVKARTEIADLVNAINAYDTEYGRFPITSGGKSGGLPVLSDEQGAAGLNDFTTGLIAGFGQGNKYGNFTYDNNSNVVSILMDLPNFPNGRPTMYPLHEKNPKQVKFLNAKMSGYDPTSNDPNPPGGVDNTGIYRDPWGNPYIITMDTSYDDQCMDFIYCQQQVSQIGADQTGFNGLVNVTDANGGGDHFLYHGKVMVWSAGPDKKYSSSQKANVGDNKDNVLSWQ